MSHEEITIDRYYRDLELKCRGLVVWDDGAVNDNPGWVVYTGRVGGWQPVDGAEDAEDSLIIEEARETLSRWPDAPEKK